MAVARHRIQDLIKVLLFPPSRFSPLLSQLTIRPQTQKQCHIFNTTYNPFNIRTGAKVLRQRLKGPTLASYYPPRPVTIRSFKKWFPGMETFEEDRADREDHLVMQKARGKGPPKKKRTKEEGKRFGKRKR